MSSSPFPPHCWSLRCRSSTCRPLATSPAVLWLSLLLAALPPAARAQLPVQTPAAPWRTVSTPHFRVHYPAPSEAWARYAGERLEAIRARVVAEVGYEPPQVVDVVVSDPYAAPNGEALPLLGGPRLVLWTSPPDAESELGTFRDWTELLVTHEETHLVHLLRPSRNAGQRLIERLLLPVGPIALKAPRWVLEGYATLIEGRLTASGRPNGDLRAVVLRRWAQAGKLPAYGALAADSESYEGGAMAYLAGSAYLEWLEERTGPGSLRKLWARLTARRDRAFGDAFRGVFGESPHDLYDRFRAELTYRAMEAEKVTLAAGTEREREGELWQELSWATGAPAVSPDGRQIALVLRDRKLPSRLVVWSTGRDEKAEKKWREQSEKVQARDPEDEPAVRAQPLPRKPLFTLAPADGVAPTMPRWMPDGRSILLVRFEPDGEGFLHPDLSLWTPASGGLRRITREADVRDPDPEPDGGWAVAVRNRNGLSQLVTVELATGEVRPLTEPSLEVIYDRPRVSPDGRRIACARHSGGVWKLALLDLRSDRTVERISELAPPWQGPVASPAWSHDGHSLYVVVGKGGFVDLYAFSGLSAAASAAGATTGPAVPAEAPSPVPVTRTRGAALAPAPTPDGSALFYLSVTPRGLSLWRQELRPQRQLPVPPAAEISAALAPAALPVPPATLPPLALAPLPPSRAYGVGRQEFSSLLGGSGSSSGGVLELGMRGGDVVGRLSYLALGAASADGWPRGGTLAGAYRGWPVSIGLAFFGTGERPSAQAGRLPATAAALDLDRRGAEVGAAWERKGAGDRFHFAGRLVWEEIAPRHGGAVHEDLGSLVGGYDLGRVFGLWRLDAGLGAHLEEGRSGGASWSRQGGVLRLAARYDDTELAAVYQKDGSHHLLRAFDRYQLGGAATSLLPSAAGSAQIVVPALPLATLVGDGHEGERAELRLGGLPVPLFYERHRLWLDGEHHGSWLSLLGLELRVMTDPIPIVRLPAADLRFGVARVHERPLPDQTRWWVVSIWRP